MNDGEIYHQMAESIVNLDKDEALLLANRAIDEKMNLLDVIEKGFGEGIRKVGELWDEGEFFLPELMAGAQVMQAAVDQLTPHLQASGSEFQSSGKIVLATIEGDIHSIGKTIVGTMLRANGFEVTDLGTDVKAEKIVEEAITVGANIVGVSTLLTTTMQNQKKVVDLLEEKKVREKIKIMLGGAPVTKSWVEECGADGYAENAVEAVKLAKLLMSDK
ncbi:MAG: cobalamin B12-binding domain-containing protein [Candidatus Hodarchaeales archaeon]|jgi:corrinoid protein of di/trimethylamine methyltransferase